MNYKIFFALLVSVSFSSVCFAHEKVVVVPLNVKKNLKNVITVAKSGGDFNDPAAAMASITDATVDNRYLIYIGPGEYSLQSTLEVKRGVSLIGAGQELTILTGAVASDHSDNRSALLGITGGTKIGSMSIENTGGGNYAFGISDSSYDLYTAYVDDVTVRVSGGSINRGVSITGTDYLSITNSRISASGGGSYSYGVYLISREINFDNVRVIVSSGSNVRGIFSNNAKITVKNSSVSASYASSTNMGIYSVNARDTKIFQSIITASHYLSGPTILSMSASGTNHVIRSSMIGAVSSSGTFSCIYSDDGEGGMLDANCN